MTRCSICDFPIKACGLTCLACQRSFCSHHAARMNTADLQCCDSCVRQCASCEAVKPVTEGSDIGEMDWLCAVCLAGSAVLNVELMPPSVGIFEESNEVCA